MFPKLVWFLFILSCNDICAFAQVHGVINNVDIADDRPPVSSPTHRTVSRRNQSKEATTGPGQFRQSEIMLVDENFEVPLPMLERQRLRSRQYRRWTPEPEDPSEQVGSGASVQDWEKMAKTTSELALADHTASNQADSDLWKSAFTELDTEFDSDIEGSGNEILANVTDLTVTAEYSASEFDYETETVTYMYITDPTIIAEYSTREFEYGLTESMLNLCMATMCNVSNDLLVKSSNDGPVLEGTNITFECISTNYSAVDLYWYKNNGSVPILMDLMYKSSNLQYHMFEAKLFDSGTYRCIKWYEGSCCYKEIYLNVYEMPAYTYHLLTIGIVAAVCLLTCILIGLWRNWSVSKYSKQYIDKNAQQTLIS